MQNSFEDMVLFVIKDGSQILYSEKVILKVVTLFGDNRIAQM